MQLNKDKIKIGVVGLGYLGRHHARILSTLENVSLQALVDIDLELAKAMSDQYGGRYFNNFRDAIDIVDAFIIATPTETHYSIAKDCLIHRKHLFIEKPITSNSKEALDLIALSESRNLAIQVGHIERFNPVFNYALHKIEKPILFESERLSPFLERTKDTDVTLDLLIHDIDLVLSILRAKGLDITTKDISAEGLSMVSNKIDFVIARVKFDSSMAILKASRISKEKIRQMSIYEENFYITLDFANQKSRQFTANNLSFKDEDVGVSEELLKIELNSFIDTLLNNRTPVVTAQQGLEALKIVEEINKIIRS